MSLGRLERDLVAMADSFEVHLRTCAVCLTEGGAFCDEGRFFREDAEEIRSALVAYRVGEDRGRFAAAISRRWFPWGVGA
ncbi:MAG TPA: hypothetical protein VGP88_01250 [Thermoplasmata archaeon]|jgi:hypothetical protein|nr:hypothetical protein [Thermoplasmata archaeon]